MKKSLIILLGLWIIMSISVFGADTILYSNNDGDTTGWVQESGVSFTDAGGHLEITGSSDNDEGYLPVSFQANNLYKIEYDFAHTSGTWNSEHIIGNGDNFEDCWFGAWDESAPFLVPDSANSYESIANEMYDGRNYSVEMYVSIDAIDGTHNFNLSIYDNSDSSVVFTRDNRTCYTNTDNTDKWTFHLYRNEAHTLQLDNMIITKIDTAPQVSLFLVDYNPDNNTQWNTDINFNVSLNATETGNCSLFLNDTLNITKDFLNGTNVLVNHTPTLEEAPYLWFWNCTTGQDWFNTTERLLYYDVTNPEISWVTPKDDNSTLVSGTIFNDIDLSDSNLYSYYYNITNSTGDVILNISNTSLTGLSTYNLLNTTEGLKDDTYISIMQVCDGHTSNEIFFNADILDNELLFDNGDIKIYLKTKTDTAKITYTKLTDRYSYSFNTKTLTDNLVYVVESKNYIDILDGKTEFEGHLISGNKWIDFEGNEVISSNVNRISDTKVEVWVYFNKEATSFKLESIGELNCITESVSFESDATAPVVTNIVPLNNSQDTDGIVSFNFNVNEYSNCSLFIDSVSTNESINDTGDLSIDYTFTSADNYTWFINCSDLAGNIGISKTYNLEVTLTETILNYGFFDTDASCLLDEDLAYVFGYIAILVIILVLFFVNLTIIKVPIVGLFLGIAEIIVTLNFYACTWTLGTMFSLIGIVMLFYEFILYWNHVRDY